MLDDDALQRTDLLDVGCERVSCSWVWSCVGEREADTAANTTANTDVVDEACWSGSGF